MPFFDGKMHPPEKPLFSQCGNTMTSSSPSSTPSPTPLPEGFSFQSVTTPEELSQVVAEVKSLSEVYLDLEADSLHHYFAKICLAQVLCGKVCYLIDPLAPLDLQPLLDVLAHKPLILHGADYDLRMLYQQYGFRPHSVFDTMIAGQLLGRKSFGLAALVQEHFGVVLEKGNQKADWSQRPLPEDMLAYAAQDTFFLPELSASLKAELAAKGRLTWHEESCALLIGATGIIRDVDRENAWRLTGSNKLKPRQLAVLRALWQFREARAQEIDKPPYRVLPSEILLRFASQTPAQGLPESWPRLPSRLPPEQKDAFDQALDLALALPSSEWPKPLKGPRRVLQGPHPLWVTALKEARDKIATGLELDPSLIATRATILAAAQTELPDRETVSNAAGWMRWQESLLLDAWMQAAEQVKSAPPPPN
jgi:ribonuclease D